MYQNVFCSLLEPIMKARRHNRGQSSLTDDDDDKIKQMHLYSSISNPPFIVVEDTLPLDQVNLLLPL